MIDEKGQIVTRNDEMSHILNEYFSSVFTVEDLSKIPIIKSRTSKDQSKYLCDLDITDEKVGKALSLKLNKSAGADGLPSTLIRKIADVIIEPLTIYTKHLRRQVKFWKIGRLLI